jgi:hypothetical protein
MKASAPFFGGGCASGTAVRRGRLRVAGGCASGTAVRRGPLSAGLVTPGLPAGHRPARTDLLGHGGNRAVDPDPRQPMQADKLNQVHDLWLGPLQQELALAAA